MTRILVVDDDVVVSSFLEKGFRTRGYSTLAIEDCARAARHLDQHPVDLVILNVDVADGEGFELLRHLRAAGERVPVIVLTSHPELRDAVACLDVGADDYLTKPVHFDELLARVRARLRPPAHSDPPLLAVAGVRLDVRGCRAMVGDRVVNLTARELALLEFFMRHPGQVFSRAELLEQVWGHAVEPGSNVINVYVNTLRHKLGIDAIDTVRGVGYRFRGH